MTNAMKDELDEVRTSEIWDDEEVRFQIADDGNGLTMDGPMALFDKLSRPLGPADLGGGQRSQFLSKFGRRSFREIVHGGAFRKSLDEHPDIVLHYQHDETSPVLGRTKSGTLRLTEETRMVRANADLPDNEWGRPVRDAVRRGDIGGISFRMGKVIDKWTDGSDGPVRHLHEVQLRREVSLVTFPGYDTPASIRSMAEDAEIEPDKLLEAFTVIRTPNARLTAEQHELLQAAIATRVETPFLDPKLVQMRERLAALAG